MVSGILAISILSYGPYCFSIDLSIYMFALIEIGYCCSYLKWVSLIFISIFSSSSTYFGS